MHENKSRVNNHRIYRTEKVRQNSRQEINTPQ